MIRYVYNFLICFINIFLEPFKDYYMKKLKQKHIQQFLQDIEDFHFGQKQKMQLQQHLTPPLLAAQLLYHIYQTQNIQEMSVLDLGAGTGMLLCGSVFIGAAYALGIEIDQKYVQIAQKQLQQKVEGGNFELINANVRQLKLKPKSFDMVVMNPPFGTKQQGIDCVFIQKAMQFCSGTIFSMHKTSTRPFLIKFCQQRGYIFQVLIQYRFPLKKRFNKYHKKQVGYTQVDVIKIFPINKNQQLQKQETSLFKKQEKTLN